MVIGVLARVEVCRGFALVRTESAAVVVIRTRKEPPVAAFAKQAVPDAANFGRVDSGTAVGAATDRIGRVAAAGRLSAMAGHRLKAKGDLWAGVIKVAQMLDVETVAASRVIDAGALKVGRNEVRRRGRLFVHPLDPFD